MNATVTPFPRAAAFTISYVAAEPEGPRRAIVDSVRDFDPASRAPRAPPAIARPASPI